MFRSRVFGTPDSFHLTLEYGHAEENPPPQSAQPLQPTARLEFDFTSDESETRVVERFVQRQNEVLQGSTCDRVAVDLQHESIPHAAYWDDEQRIRVKILIESTSPVLRCIQFARTSSSGSIPDSLLSSLLNQLNVPNIWKIRGADGLGNFWATRVDPSAWKSLRHLNLSCCGLTSLPPEVGQLAPLQVLRLTSNKLTMLPPAIGDLGKLEVLAADHNQLTFIPVELRRCTSLRELQLESNKLVNVLLDLTPLTALASLQLFGNPLDYLPELAPATSLRSLSLANVRVLADTRYSRWEVEVAAPSSYYATIISRAHKLAPLFGLVFRRASIQHPLLAGALARLCEDPSNCELLLREEVALQQVVAMAMCQEDLVAAQALEVLRALGQLPGAARKLIRHNAVRAITLLVASDDQESQLGGLAVLSNLAAGAEERDRGDRLVPTQLLDRLLHLARYGASEEVRCAALEALGNSAFDVVTRRRYLQSPGLMHLLVDLATRPEPGSSGEEGLEEEEAGRAAAAAVMAPRTAAAPAGTAVDHDLKVPASLLRRHAIRLLAILGQNEQVRIALKQPPIRGRGLRILAMDGGGMKGMAMVEMLRQIERRAGRPVWDLFDIIGGTSTGGLLAVAIGLLRMSLDECQEMYTSLGNKVFHQSAVLQEDAGWKESLYRLYSTSTSSMKVAVYGYKHDAGPYEALLKDFCQLEKMGCVSDRMIDTAVLGGPKVFAVATLASRRPAAPFAFRNYELPFEVGDLADQLHACTGSCRHYLWQAVRASSAAPYYLEDFICGTERFQDGAATANNPSVIALQQGLLLHPDLPIDVLVSLGCGSEPASDRGKGLSSMMDTGTVLVESACSVDRVDEALATVLPLVPGVKYYRFNPEHVHCGMELDEINPEAWLKLMTATTDYCTSPDVAAAFDELSHILNSSTTTSSSSSRGPSSTTVTIPARSSGTQQQQLRGAIGGSRAVDPLRHHPGAVSSSRGLGRRLGVGTGTRPAKHVGGVRDTGAADAAASIGATASLSASSHSAPSQDGVPSPPPPPAAAAAAGGGGGTAATAATVLAAHQQQQQQNGALLGLSPVLDTQHPPAAAAAVGRGGARVPVAAPAAMAAAERLEAAAAAIAPSVPTAAAASISSSDPLLDIEMNIPCLDQKPPSQPPAPAAPAGGGAEGAEGAAAVPLPPILTAAQEAGSFSFNPDASSYMLRPACSEILPTTAAAADFLVPPQSPPLPSAAAVAGVDRVTPDLAQGPRLGRRSGLLLIEAPRHLPGVDLTPELVRTLPGGYIELVAAALVENMDPSVIWTCNINTSSRSSSSGGGSSGRTAGSSYYQQQPYRQGWPPYPQQQISKPVSPGGAGGGVRSSEGGDVCNLGRSHLMIQADSRAAAAAAAGRRGDGAGGGDVGAVGAVAPAPAAAGVEGGKPLDDAPATSGGSSSWFGMLFPWQGSRSGQQSSPDTIPAAAAAKGGGGDGVGTGSSRTSPEQQQGAGGGDIGGSANSSSSSASPAGKVSGGGAAAAAGRLCHSGGSSSASSPIHSPPYPRRLGLHGGTNAPITSATAAAGYSKQQGSSLDSEAKTLANSRGLSAEGEDQSPLRRNSGGVGAGNKGSGCGSREELRQEKSPRRGQETTAAPAQAVHYTPGDPEQQYYIQQQYYTQQQAESAGLGSGSRWSGGAQGSKHNDAAAAGGGGGGGGGGGEADHLLALRSALAASAGHVGVVHLAVHSRDQGLVLGWQQQLQALVEPGVEASHLAASLGASPGTPLSSLLLPPTTPELLPTADGGLVRVLSQQQVRCPSGLSLNPTEPGVSLAGGGGAHPVHGRQPGSSCSSTSMVTTWLLQRLLPDGERLLEEEGLYPLLSLLQQQLVVSTGWLPDGLLRALLQGGVRGVVVPADPWLLEEVEAAAVARFFVEFYRGLYEGLAVTEALQLAGREVPEVGDEVYVCYEL